MAQQDVNLSKDNRCSVTCPSSSNDIYHFRLKRLTKENLQCAFGIPAKTNFCLINKNNDIEFTNVHGLFDAEPNTLYQIQFTKPLMVIVDKEDDNKIDWNQSHLLDLSTGSGGTGSYVL